MWLWLLEGVEFLLFVKIFPSISIYEIKETMDAPKKQGDRHET